MHKYDHNIIIHAVPTSTSLKGYTPSPYTPTIVTEATPSAPAHRITWYMTWDVCSTR